MEEREWDESNWPSLLSRGSEAKACSSEGVAAGGRASRPEWEGKAYTLKGDAASGVSSWEGRWPNSMEGFGSRAEKAKQRRGVVQGDIYSSASSEVSPKVNQKQTRRSKKEEAERMKQVSSGTLENI